MKYIRLYEDREQRIETLKRIADQLGERMHCNRYGVCVHFAEEFVVEVAKVDMGLLDLVTVVEGWVDWEHGEGVPQQHTWIELEDGTLVDPTFIQFIGRANYNTRKRSNRYSGVEYLSGVEGSWFKERRERYRDQWFKD